MKQTLVCLLLAASIFGVVEFGLLLHSVRTDLSSNLKELKSTIEQVRATATTLNQYTAEQAKVFNSTENRQMQQALRDAAATTIKILRKVDQKTIPELNLAISGLAEVESVSGVVIQSIGDSVNGRITPSLVSNLEDSDRALKELSKTLEEASNRANLSLDDIHLILSDPDWLATLHEIKGISEHADGISGDIDRATDSMPGIAASLERISKTSSKYQKYVILSQIFSAITRAFF